MKIHTEEIYNEALEVNRKKHRNSAWTRGLETYIELLLWNAFEGNTVIETSWRTITKQLLIGADTFRQYSYGGCAYIYNRTIAAILCTPSEWRKKKFGRLNPNSKENWLDVQTRALNQAAACIFWAVYTIEKSGE